jgi:hypothetical protein
VPYCSHCGVEVDPATVKCPLCENLIPQIPTRPILPSIYPEREHRLHYQRRKFTYREKISVLNFILLILLIPSTIVLSIDLILNGEMSWSIYPLTAFGAVLAVIICTLFIRKALLLLLSYLILAVIIALLFHLISGTLESYLRWSFPITLAGSVITFLSFLYGRKASSRGMNIAGVSLWALALFCLVVDYVVSRNLDSRKIVHGWSIIAGSGLFPLGALFFYVHYRFGGKLSLKRYFNV